MSALILVVDDTPANVMLLEAKLTNEYYDVVTAVDGFEAIKQAKEHSPDLILLDVMMPGMDGFETCRQMKADPAISHIPVVMVTALNSAEDRVNGLQAGADDFLTKPIDDAALMARVRSLVRIKTLIDELRLRDQSGAEMGVLGDNADKSFLMDVSGSRVLLIDDDIVQSKYIVDGISQTYQVTQVTQIDDTMRVATEQPFDCVLVSTQLSEVDGLRLSMHLKTKDELRHIPLIIMVDEEERNTMLKGLELGVNDYISLPVDLNELHARVQTQIRRKKYQDALKSNYQQTISMAITDGLTGLYNRHFLSTHLNNMVQQALQTGRPLSNIILDMDKFKSVNDTYGHDVGDEVLVQLSKVIVNAIRSADLAARYGGEEFVVLMPETDIFDAAEVAERIRVMVERTPFKVSHAVGELNLTVSVGVSHLRSDGDTAQELHKRADEALYRCKEGGRNQVQLAINEYTTI
jgi:two-component system, cell cycle response regulator